MSPLGAALAFRLAALSLLLCAVAVHSASQRGNNAAKAEAEPAAAAARGPRRRLRSYCHPETAELIENGSAPLPCTEEQEIDALQDLYQELPDVQDPTQAVIDTSACNATDPEGYTQAVDLFNSGVAEVATTIGEEYVAAAGNESYWQTECNGDLTTDAYNACRQPQATEPQAEPGTQFKIWLKLSCSGSTNDTVALEAFAFLASGDNSTVVVDGWEEIPLPGPGQ